MTERERLINLIHSADASLFGKDEPFAGVYADHLLAGGVIVPPCKIGDEVYLVGTITGRITTCEVIGINYRGNDLFLMLDSNTFVSTNQQLGKAVFLTREEAEQALKERKEE